MRAPDRTIVGFCASFASSTAPGLFELISIHHSSRTDPQLRFQAKSPIDPRSRQSSYCRLGAAELISVNSFRNFGSIICTKVDCFHLGLGCLSGAIFLLLNSQTKHIDLLCQLLQMIHANSVESPGRAPEIENLIPPSSSQSTKPTLCWQTLICGYFDEDQEGKITRKEFVEKPSAFIRRFDRNGD
jgi:hypothetical protein